MPSDRRRWFATAMPGIGRLLAQQLRQSPGIHIGAIGFDGRKDIVAFDTDAVAAQWLKYLTAAEDVFAQIGHTSRRDGDRPAWIAQRLCHRTPIAEAIASRRSFGMPTATPTVRAVVRVLSETAFTRTQLRRTVTAAVLGLRPDWTVVDPACHELWVLEYRPGLFIAGVRMTDGGWRQAGGRDVELPGALRPSVASAMVTLAGHRAGRLLDPCCGTGTVLRAAQLAGWRTSGVDLDPAAVEAARRNTECADLHTGDACALPYADNSFDAWVSNPPFGKQHALPADAHQWLEAVYLEAVRVVRPGGQIVILHPVDPRPACPALQVTHHYWLRLLGYETTLWRTHAG